AAESAAGLGRVCILTCPREISAIRYRPRSESEPQLVYHLAGRVTHSALLLAWVASVSKSFRTCDGDHKQTSAATLRLLAMEIGEPTEITMATSTIFIPLPGFTWVSGGRSVEGQFCDKAEEFRACAAECQEIAT